MAINFLQNDLISLLEQNETPKNLSGIYGTDLTEQELAAGIKPTEEAAGTPTYKIPEFDRYAFAPRDYGALPSMYELYLSGGFDAAQDDFVTPSADTTPVDTGGGGGGNLLDQLETNTGINTPFEQNLIDQGVGVQIAPGQPVVAPGEMPVTQEEMDAFNQIPVTPVNEFPTGDASLAEQIAAEDRAAKALADEQALTNLEQARTGQYDAPTETYADTGDPDLLDLAGGELGGSDAGFADKGVPVGEAYAPTDTINYSELDDLEADPGTQPVEGLTTEQSNTLQNIVGQAGQTVEGAMNQLSKIPGAVADFANQTVDIFGKKFNVGKTLLSAGINKLAGGPISLVFDALGALGLEGGRSEMSDKLGEQYGMDDIGTLTGGPMAGYNVDSTFGKGIEQSTADVKNDVGNTLSEKYGFTKSELDQIAEGTYTGTKGYNEIMGTTTNLVDRYKDLSNFEKQIDKNKTAIDYDMEGTDEGDRAAEEATEARKEGLEELSDIYSGIGQTRDEPSPTPAPSPTPPGPTGQDIHGGGGNQGGNTGGGGFDPGGGFVDQGGAGEFGGAPSGPSAPSGSTAAGGPTYGPHGGASYGPHGGGGGGGGGGGKIVCTMMNDSYGFGSFRNKIWLRQSKNLAPEYQIGYHKIFLPLVRLSKTNKVLKKTLEHIAVHRTIDIRQEARGKVHLLGRVYRKILEPICYWVGKYAKR